MKTIIKLLIIVALLCYIFPEFQNKLTNITFELINKVSKIDIEKQLFHIQHIGEGNSNNVIASAKELMGVKYKYGGTSIKSGIDCSFFLKYIYEQQGITLPRTSKQQYKEGFRVSKKNLLPGDLIFFSKNPTVFSKPSHVALYIGDNKFIHATSNTGNVSEGNLTTAYYQSIYLGARRI